MTIPVFPQELRGSGEAGRMSLSFQQVPYIVTSHVFSPPFHFFFSDLESFHDSLLHAMVSISLSIILMPSITNHGTPVLLGELRAESYWESLDSSTSCPLPPSEPITALANVNLFMAWLTLGLFPNPGQVEKGPGTGGQGKGG